MWLFNRFPGLSVAYHRMVMKVSRSVLGIDGKKVVFCCFSGRSYGDNPRAISERLHELCPEAKIVWRLKRNALERLAGVLPDYVKPVNFNSRQSLIELATARVWVDNFSLKNYVVPVEGRQEYIQTWHGDRAIKKICYDLEEPGKWRVEEKCSRVVTASAFGEKMFRTAFRYKGEYIRAGSPRNDILVRNDPADTRRVREKLGVGPQVRLLLYAPTYRENESVVPKRAQMDMDRTLRCLEEATGERWMCLFRAHYKSAGIDLEAIKGRIVDATQYDDMAELLMAADMLLTDYSSCAFDYILRDKPALFFIADWEEYLSTRGVYFDVREAPLMTAANQDELETLIRGLTPERVRQNCAEIREYFGYYETGHATDAVCDYIIECLGGRDRQANGWKDSRRGKA